MSDPLEGEPLVLCEGLVRRFARTTALAGLDLTLRAGAPIALVGPNGAGKSTLLSLLAGFLRPSAGRVRVFGEVPGGAASRGRLAALPQDALLDPRLSVGHQLRVLAELQGFPRRAARREVERVLASVALADVARHRPLALSHGMRKRVALAQALIGDPTLVLLDEPTAGIDPENARTMRELIASRAARTTFLISSHNLDELETLCGSVVQLEAGRVVRHESLSTAATSSGRKPIEGAWPDMTADTFPNTVTETATASRARHSAASRGGGQAAELTLRLPGVPSGDFETAANALSVVRSLRRLPEGDWLIGVEDETAGAVALLELLAARGWSWRHLVRGRSLAERLYGER